VICFLSIHTTEAISTYHRLQLDNQSTSSPCSNLDFGSKFVFFAVLLIISVSSPPFPLMSVLLGQHCSHHSQGSRPTLQVLLAPPVPLLHLQRLRARRQQTPQQQQYKQQQYNHFALPRNSFPVRIRDVGVAVFNIGWFEERSTAIGLVMNVSRSLEQVPEMNYMVLILFR